MKRIIVSAVLIFVCSVTVFVNYASVMSDRYVPKKSVSSGVQKLESLEKNSVDKAQISIDAVEKEKQQNALNGDKQNEIKKIIKKIDKGEKTFSQAFRNVWFVGDSLMNGLATYNVINNNHVISQVSASLFHLEDNYSKIVQARPPVLILHYGLNMISPQDVHLNNFISKYSSIIERLKKDLPQTRIIVSLLFPVDRSRATAPRFGAVDKWNNALVNMCKKEKVEYLNSSSVLKAHNECYAKDGIHQSKSFYIYWLKFIMLKKEIY